MWIVLIATLTVFIIFIYYDAFKKAFVRGPYHRLGKEFILKDIQSKYYEKLKE